MAQPKPLIVSAPMQGIAQSPHLGFGDVRNLDIYTVPGAAKLNNILAKKTAATVDAFVKWIVKNPASPANIYAVDSNGSVYNSANSGATWAELSDRAGSGQGLVVWKDYLFVCEDTTIDVYGPLSGAAAWTNGWQTIDSDTAWHPMITSYNDGNIYGGAGRYIFSIAEVSGQNFAPATGATYTFTQQALDLPEDYKIKCLAELGNNLLIGTWMGTNVYDNKIADIFPWDRSSASFNKPVQIGEHGVHAMLNIDNSIFVLAGIGGAIYRTDGYNVYKIGQIPNYIADLDGGKYLEYYPGSLINYKGRPFFGVGNTAALDGIGVYSLMQTSAGNKLVFEHQISTNETGVNDVVKIGALLGVTRDSLLVAWEDTNSTAFGIDLTTTTNRYTGYTGYFISPFYQIGTYLQRREFSNIELHLSKELAANQAVKVEARVNLTDSWTAVGTYTFTNLGAVAYHAAQMNMPASEFLQFKISPTGTTTTPHFKNITLT